MNFLDEIAIYFNNRFRVTMEQTPAINPETYAMLQVALAEILPELKAAFIEDSYILLQQIKDNLPSGDITLISRAAHTLKSSAQNMGADALAIYCAEIEENPAADAAVISELHAKALTEMQAAQVFLEANN